MIKLLKSMSVQIKLSNSQFYKFWSVWASIFDESSRKQKKILAKNVLEIPMCLHSI